MDYKKKLDIMQKKERIRAFFGTISVISFVVFFFIIIGFYPITISRGDRSDSIYLMYFALKSEYRLFLRIAIFSFILSIVSFVAILISNRLLEKMNDKQN